MHEKVALLGSRRPKKSHSRADGRTWAYWATNDAGRHDLQPISYQAFRQRSGLDLLAQTVAALGLPPATSAGPLAAKLAPPPAGWFTCQAVGVAPASRRLEW